MKISGNALLAQALVRQRVETLFFLMGGPMMEVGNMCTDSNIRMIDVRHEQAAAMMAHAYARVTSKVGVCMACSGPGAINLTTGLANALVDCSPVVALGGSSTLADYGTSAFQEIDQVAIMRPVTKWAERVYQTKRIPEYVATAFRQAVTGKPGPVYLDIPGDLLYAEVEEEDVRWPSETEWQAPRASGDPALIAETVKLLNAAKRPLIISGTGVFWSGATDELQGLVEDAGIPFYTSPQGRGAIPEDHKFFYPCARSTAFREADLVLVIGTRLNYMLKQGRPPRFHPEARFVRVDTDPAELARGDLGNINILGDAGHVLQQLRAAIKAKITAKSFESWRTQLHEIECSRSPKEEASLAVDQTPIHPLRLCKEVRDFMDRDAILVVDGQEILNYGRRAIPTFLPKHRLNSGPFGTMGVGLPFGIGAKAARPDKQVIVLSGDGSFGMNCMELDVAIRHKLPLLVVISLNGGWTASDRRKPGRDLGYTRFDKLAETLGCHGEYVERPEGIRAALERASAAVAQGKTAVVNVLTDHKARAATVKFSTYTT